MKEPENQSSINTEEDARHFLKQWPKFVDSADPQDKVIMYDALESLENYPQLDVIPFYLACLNHPDELVRLEAVPALTRRLKSIPRSSEGILALLRVLHEDPDPHVRGGAAWALGILARVHDIPDILSKLLTLVSDRSEHNNVRVDAYKGIIYLLDRVGDPRYHPYNIRLNLPADEQIDWNWIEELRKKTGG